MDIITYYLIGLLTGVSATAFFVGKEFYKYYVRYNVQQKQMNRILKLNEKLKNLVSIETSALKVG